MEDNEQLQVMPGAFALMPVMNIQSAKLRYTQFQEFVKECMKEGSDYGKVPGTNKDTLLKPGAEKLLSLFGLSVRLTCAEKIEDWTGRDHDGEPFFYYRYQCAIYAGLSMVVESDGSCNSREVKYRYRNSERTCPTCGKATIIKGKAEYGGGWICFGKKGGCGAKFPEGSAEIEQQITGKVANPDICDQVNTFQKMAQKRALIGSALIATNASEFFTQDMEDFAPTEHQGFENAKPVNGKANGQTQAVSPEDARVNSALIDFYKRKDQKGEKNGEAFFNAMWAKKSFAEREAEAKRLGLITAAKVEEVIEQWANRPEPSSEPVIAPQAEAVSEAKPESKFAPAPMDAVESLLAEIRDLIESAKAAPLNRTAKEVNEEIKRQMGHHDLSKMSFDELTKLKEGLAFYLKSLRK